MTRLSLLEELRLLEKELGPTEHFRRIYGNYCGPGNRGGAPVDGLDAACKCHDECYNDMGYGDSACDQKIIDEVQQFLRSKKVTFKQRTFATLILTFFKLKLKRRHEAT